MKYTYRIGYNVWRFEKLFEKHLKMIKRNIDDIDEIALMVGISHQGFCPISKVEQDAKILGKCIQEYKKLNVKSVGINILGTIGHMDDNWSWVEAPEMTAMIGADGSQSKAGCFCLNTVEFRNYVKERYKIYASAKPDFIFVDDDIRLYNHGTPLTCFCDECIQKYNEKYQENENFDSWTDKLKNAEYNSDMKRWIEFQSDNYSELLDCIKEAVQSQDSKIQLGLMTVPSSCCEPWVEALGAQKVRPGGGYYTDDRPRDMIKKYLFTRDQIAHLPKKNYDCLYEYESFPWQEFGKSEKIITLELLYALMSGCNGIAFTTNWFNDDYTEILLRIVNKNKHFWDTVSELISGMNDAGIYCAELTDYGIRIMDIFDPHIKNIAADFMEIGLPISISKKQEDVIVLTGNTVTVYSDDELKKILSGRVYIDGDALDILTKKGLNHYCGVVSEKYYSNGVMEQFSDNNLNAKYVDYRRSGWMNFDLGFAKTSSLKIIAEGVEIISELINFENEKLGPCMTAYKNVLGGNIIVDTYMFTSKLAFNAKREQILNVFDWLYDGCAPVRVNVNQRICPIMKKNDKGNYVLMLANMSFDEVNDFTVDILTNNDSYKKIDMDGLKSSGIGMRLDGKMRASIKQLKPWEAIILTDMDI